MKIIKASYEILRPTKEKAIEDLRFIELCARTCYKSEDKITETSYIKMIEKLRDNKHLAMFDHANMSVKFICDRGFSHELVRHRLAAYAQESTRYANYSKDKFGSEITVIAPLFFKEDSIGYTSWAESLTLAEKAYLAIINDGGKAQEARTVLPNSLKTEIICTASLTEWRHIFKLRTSTAAHPQMRELMVPLLAEVKTLFPIIFDDI